MRKTKILKNCIITSAILFLVTLFCFVLKRFSETDTHVPLLFVLAVLCISRFTDGYIYGIVASILAVVGVNYGFTYPYFEIDFSLTGYSMTFLAMLAVACSVSALTTQIKGQEQIRLEVEKEKMRGNLLRAVSHDIRTPLTSISGTASALLENFDHLSKTDTLELLKNMRDESQWLVRIVENLLSITRIEHGNGNARLSTQEELAEEIVSSAIVKFKKRFPDVDVCAELPTEPILVSMDGILIEQVLVNLLENSVIHGKTTSVIRIRVMEMDGWTMFCVEDDGDGIKENIFPRIFDGNLHPGNGMESDSKRNMGIGLSVCMSIVKAHKGKMKAENRESGGARFTFWLPR